MMVVPGSITNKFKKIRPLLAIVLALSVLFYYTFLNEEYELNQHLDETALPRVTKEKGQPQENLPENDITKEEHELPELSTPQGLKEKNKYYPLLELEEERSRMEDFELPEVYFKDQFSLKLRPHKKKFRYAVGNENYHKFPKIKKKEEYPAVQSTYFTDGGLKVEAKLQQIKKAFIDSWKTYRDYGYGHDEVLPISHKASDPFSGWSATIVDALDTMKLLGLDQEFNDAVKYLHKVNFKQSFRDDIPIFENTIRVLAGLISGYEMSNEKFLLNSAQDLAELLIEAFDTPNNMPLLYYKWRHEIQNRFASKEACLAEVGSLSLEFSRLTQLTGDNKYYDAITRITKLFEKSFDKFYLPGLYTNRVDISGCKIINDEQVEGFTSANVVKAIHGEEYKHCVKQDFIVAPSKKEKYSIGGLGDSFYEYLPKMFHLLRGHEDDAKPYKEMYLRAMEQIRKYMLFTPRIPGGDKSLFVSSVTAVKEQGELVITQDLDMQHLTCFAGGMFALGSRLFDIPADLELAEKITYGCVDLYKRLKIMPESLRVDRKTGPSDAYNEADRLLIINREIDLNVGKPGDPEYLDAKKEALLRQLEKAQKEETKELAEKGTDPSDVIDANSQKSSKEITGKKQQKREETTKAPISPLYPKKLTYNNAKILPPFKTLDDGSKIWKVGDTYNQPLWINAMSPKYILRPEAIESVYYMYRITGDSKWRDYGWDMWLNVEKHCRTEDGQFASIADITNLKSTSEADKFEDSLESFWFAETLKYYYLLFEDISVWSLDEYVLNTEAHPFKLAV